VAQIVGCSTRRAILQTKARPGANGDGSVGRAMAKATTKSGSSVFGLFGPTTRSMRYADCSTRPLHVLVFLLPFIILYEVGSWYYLRKPSEGVQDSIAAYGILASFFRAFGVASFHIPPIVLLTILTVWHILEKDPLIVKPRYLAGMLGESMVWTLPLLIFGLLIQSSALMSAGTMDQASLAALSWQAKLTLSAGAGVYEELLFRFIVIAGVYFVVADLLQASKGVALTVGAVVSAVLFALYHNLDHPGGGIQLRLLAYYAVAGLYFAALFIFRGLGIAVAAHFLYDAIVLLAATGSTD